MRHIVEFMDQKSNTLRRTALTDISWGNELQFLASEIGGGGLPNPGLGPEASPTAELEPVVQKLLETLIRSANASSGIVRIFPTHGEAPQLISSAGIFAALFKPGHDFESNCRDGCRIPLDDGVYMTVLHSCTTTEACPYAGSQIQSLLTASIVSRYPAKESIGTITLHFNETLQGPEAISRTVLTFADLLATIVEHDKANREVKRAELIAERQSIANEIHDSLAQSLVYTRMRTSLLLESIRTLNAGMVAKYAHDIDDALASSQRTVRELITEFRCAMDPAGLLHALQMLAREFRHRSGIALEYTNLVANLELPLEYEIQVSHIVKEALANIATHSGASQARLVVELTGSGYVFTMEDNGSGGCTFTPIEGHYGMKIMRERAQRIGGEIIVESADGYGTRVQLIFPEPKSDWRKVNE